MLLTFSGTDDGPGVACITIGEVDVMMDASSARGGVGADAGAKFTATWTSGAARADWHLFRGRKSFFNTFGGWCTVASPRDYFR